MKPPKVFCLSLAVTFLLLVGARHIASAQSPLREKPVQVGEVAPDFTLEDQNGEKIKLSSARTSSPVVLVFYRGYW